jgi:hypothetical protein
MDKEKNRHDMVILLLLIFAIIVTAIASPVYFGLFYP